MVPNWFTRNVFNRIVAGLTRLGISVWGSRVLEVRGRKSGEPRRVPVNVLMVEGTKYLASLHNAVWEPSDLIPGIPVNEQQGIDKSHQLSIRRARIGLEMVMRHSLRLLRHPEYRRQVHERRRIRHGPIR